MLNSIKSLFGFGSPKTFEHLFFGVLAFSKRRHQKESFWLSYVSHNNESIQVRVLTDGEPPSDKHEEFF